MRTISLAFERRNLARYLVAARKFVKYYRAAKAQDIDNEAELITKEYWKLVEIVDSEKSG